jgi:hypothetical protein
MLFGLYHTVNMLPLGYKNQSVNAVKENDHCLFYKPRKPHKYAALLENTECLNVTPSDAHNNCCYLNGK